MQPRQRKTSPREQQEQDHYQQEQQEQQQDQDQSLLDECNVFVKYLPPDLSDTEFYKLFKSYGTIVSSKIMVDQGTGKSLGYGFVRYNNSAASQKAIHHMNGQRVSNKRLLCKLANLSPSSYSSEFSKHPILSSQTPSDNIYIKPLLKDTSEEDLRKLFGKFGQIVDCKVMIDRNTGLSRQIGFVRFETKDQATAAIDEMNNYKLYPSAPPLTVKFADTKEQKNARKALRQKQLKGDRYGSASPQPSQTTFYYYQQPYPYNGYAYNSGFNYISPSELPYGSTFASPPSQYASFPQNYDIFWCNYGDNYYEQFGDIEGFENGYFNHEFVIPYPYSPDGEYYHESYDGESPHHHLPTSPSTATEEETDVDDDLLPSSPVVAATPPIDTVH